MIVPIKFRMAQVETPEDNLRWPRNSARPKMKGQVMNELVEAMNEVRRERTIRASVYPRMVACGKLSQSEADRRLATLGWAQAFLYKLSLNPDLLSLLDGRTTQPPQTIHD